MEGRRVAQSGAMRRAVIDFQAFTGDSRAAFIVKELSLVDLKSLHEEHFVFKPPRELPLEEGRSPNDRWLEKHFHRLSWSEGDHEYSFLEVVLERIAKKYWFIYAKGNEKCDFLEGEARHPVYDLQMFGCPGLKQLKKNVKCLNCPNHKGPQEAVCSRLQARVLAGWANRNMDSIDLLDQRVRVNTFSNWASAQDPSRLTRFGFVHIRGTKSGLRCVYCEFELYKVACNSNPQKEHLESSPDCPSFKQQ